MGAILKAIKDFNEGISTVARAKKERRNLSKQAGKELNYKQANSFFQVRNYQSIINKYFESDFWELAREVVKEGYSFNQFVDILKGAVNESFVDELLREDLQGLYDYIQGVKY